MNPHIMHADELTFVGMVAYGQTKIEIGNLWTLFTNKINLVKNAHPDRLILTIWSD